jgi:HSP20 family protein
MMAENESGVRVGRRFVSRVVNLKIALQPHAWHPPTDMFETQEGYTVRVEIAGISEEDFSVSFMEKVITVAGRRVPLNEKCAYHRLEIPYGEFTASVQLPADADLSVAAAEYENGFLTITIPKSREINIHIKPEKG